MELFTVYQIPSDLISFSGPLDTPSNEKLLVVKEHVKAILSTIKIAKEKELEEERLRAKKELAEGGCGAEYREEEQCYSSDDDEEDMGGGMAMFSCDDADYGCAFTPVPAPAPVPKPAPTSTPAPAPQKQIVQAKPKPEEPRQYLPAEDGHIEAGTEQNAVEDYTKIPGLLDKQCGTLDLDSALRPTTIKMAETWHLKFQRGLLSKPTSRSLDSEAQDEEKAKAFDLLDALSRSGALPICSASLHIVLASTHCFDKTLMDTIVKANVNPIEKIERSILLVAGVVHNTNARSMIKPEAVGRIAEFSPHLLENGDSQRRRELTS